MPVSIGAASSVLTSVRWCFVDVRVYDCLEFVEAVVVYEFVFTVELIVVAVEFIVFVVAFEVGAFVGC